MKRCSKHHLIDNTSKKDQILEQIFKDYEEDLYFYMNLIIKNELSHLKNLSTKNIPINKLQHSQWRKQCYQHASREISSLKGNLDKDIYKRYKKVFKYFKKRNRQRIFLEKRFNELKLIKKIKIPKFKTISMNLDSTMFDITKDSKRFDEFIRVFTPYKNPKYRRNHFTINIPLKYHKHSNRFLKNKWNRCNTLILRKDSAGKFLLNIVWKKEVPLKSEGTSLGIDSGYKKLLTTSRGEFVGTKDINSIYDKLERRVQGSKNRKQSLIQRNEFINFLINNLSISDLNRIFIEDLNKLNYKNKCNKRYTGWVYRYVLDKLSRHCEENGILLTRVNPAYTSQECSRCGAIHEESRLKELYSCIECKNIIDADYNAALNILHRGERIYNNSNMIPLLHGNLKEESLKCKIDDILLYHDVGDEEVIMPPESIKQAKVIVQK